MDNYLEQLDKIYRKAEQLAEGYDKLKADKLELKTENEKLIALLKEQGEQIEQLEHELKVVKVAKQLSAFPDEDRTEMKKKINEFIKEIDKCVALLNQ